jgi:hypothetical protein
MKKVLFVLLCVAAVAVVPACKHLSCKKEEAPMIPPQTEQTVPAPLAAAPMPAPVPAP